MKKLFLFSALFFTTIYSNVLGQDIIVTKDAKRIEAQVNEVNVNTIKYKHFNNLDGPVYILSKAQ